MSANVISSRPVGGRPQASVLLAVTVLLATAAPARGRAEQAWNPAPPASITPRAPARHTSTPATSLCRPKVLEVSRGAVFLGGRRIHPDAGKVQILVPPIWRRDRCAVAWIERTGTGEPRLIVIPALPDTAAAPAPSSILPWPLPSVSPRDRLFWAGHTRVVVGPALLAPRAVATWTEEI